MLRPTEPISSDPFQRPFLGAPTILSLDAAPRPPRRTSDGHLIGAAIRPNAGLRAAYDARLRRLIDEMNASVLYWLTAAYRGDERIKELASDASPSVEISEVIRRLRSRWLRRFRDGSEDLARYFATAVYRRTDTELRKTLKRAGMTVEFKISRSAQNALSAIVRENVSLIRSIPEQYFTQIEGIAMRSIVRGRDLAGMTTDLQHQHGVTRRRAEFISLDQNNKATTAIQHVQYTDLGIERAIWRHSHAGRVPRPTHVANDGQEYDTHTGWFDPHEREYVLPGQLPRCKCYSQPILPR